MKNDAGAPGILTLNAGSSSIKFALFGIGDTLERKFYGNASADSSVGAIIKDLSARPGFAGVAAIGHRVVHGGPKYYEPTLINDDVLSTLRGFEAFDPEHLPEEIRLIEEFHALFPDVPQVACFDTSFHHDLPPVARILPIPRKYEEQGLRRYGFHGLSYAFLMQEIARIYGDEVAHGRIVLAHLGSGASLTAVRNGKSFDTTMAFTPSSGVPMSTRSGDIDPGLAWFFSRKEGMDAKRFNAMITNESGLLGISGTSADMKVLIENEANDHRAAEAVDFFCYQVKKYVGAYAAALGGIDILVFTGGIGEQAPKIRSRVSEGLGFLGIELDEGKNKIHAPVISKEDSSVKVLVMHTDEEKIIAEAVARMIKK